MLSLYRSAAEPDGRPRQHRKFGSNTVRLLRPSASTSRYLPASGDHHYTFMVEYDLDSFPLAQLVRASFIHLRSSLPSTTAQPFRPPQCRSQIASLAKGSHGGLLPGDLVTLEPHDDWTETDITAHVSGHILQGRSQGAEGPLTLTAEYWCTEPGYVEEDGDPSWWMPWGRYLNQLRVGKRKSHKGDTMVPHMEVPSLLLYLEEEREVENWIGDLLGSEGASEVKLSEPLHPTLPRRHRRSKDDLSSSKPKDPFLDTLREAPTSSSSSVSSSLPPTSPTPSVFSDLPNYSLKTSTPRNRCKLHSFRLSFDELGWGQYFIAPPVYNPRFCQGDCPRVLHYGYHSPNHAIIQTVINDMGVGEVPPPSCVPYKYIPMSVLVVHKKRVEYRELEDMVAESCTCR
ncbi:bone morphogenetic protein 15 [Lampris incognitus]|uniref:bone morphogenetic protein 15 n=1 Tax=Lampris incognitus TaxID=2546036 RepID=UPI0024B4DF33|nr:bone morphogenetic protein 15 [Lampris incognitus]